MKDTDHHDRFLVRQINDQVVVKLRDDEPADLRVTRCRLAKAASQLTMLGKKVSVFRMVRRTRSAAAGLLPAI